MTWQAVTSPQQLDFISERSHQVPCLIFKHSTHCNVSSIARHRLEANWDFDSDEIEPFFLDLLAYRKISNEISRRFDVFHESPQILLIKKGECILDASHLDISVEEIREVLMAVGF
ncbi:MAG: bacillithiol system redox-active protein YtxJ [Bacteroidetes bacterium]|nr:bacillithiol system redox-active protein YtxJ [Bacteroidota bacterium]